MPTAGPSQFVYIGHRWHITAKEGPRNALSGVGWCLVCPRATRVLGGGLKPRDLRAADVSVVIPARDEAHTILALLGDLRAQRRRPTEILVVDTGSQDDTAKLVATLSAQDRRIRLLSAPGAYPGGARNVAIRVVRTEWIAFVDAGVRVAEDWLELLFEPIDQTESVDAVLGGLEPIVETRIERAAALAYVSPLAPLPGGGLWRGYCLPSSIVRTSVVRKVRGFPEGLRCGEDLHFFNRLKEAACFAYAPKATARWSMPSDLGGVWRRFRLYAEHALRGGFREGWFGTAARRYGLMLLLCGPLVPAAAVALLIGRAIVMQYRKPEWVDTALKGRARQVLEVAAILGIIDAAIWAGWWAWRRGGSPVADPLGPADLMSPQGPDTRAPSG